MYCQGGWHVWLEAFINTLAVQLYPSHCRADSQPSPVRNLRRQAYVKNPGLLRDCHKITCADCAGQCVQLVRQKRSRTASYRIAKGATTFTAKVSSASVKTKALKKSKKTLAVKVTKLSAGSTKPTCSIKSVSNGQKKNVSVNASGKVTIKKGTKKCKIVIKVTSKANKDRKAGTKTVKIQVK